MAERGEQLGAEDVSVMAKARGRGLRREGMGRASVCSILIFSKTNLRMMHCMNACAVHKNYMHAVGSGA